MSETRCALWALAAMLDDPDDIAATEAAAECYTGTTDATDMSHTDLFECDVQGCLVNCQITSWFDEETGEHATVLRGTDGPCATGIQTPLLKVVKDSFVSDEDYLQ